MSTLTYWFTGLPGSGKSTLAAALAAMFRHASQACAVLDGDAMRRGLCADLGFEDAHRRENLRRIAEVARMLNDNGIHAIAAVIAPSTADRLRARRIIGEPRFREVFVDAPLAVCESRDPKGMYRRARAGLLANFTGVSAPYEAPTKADVHLLTSVHSIGECTERLFADWRSGR
ncbi:MAG TPA: adenylyl-sulfate kinase [Albitalea sp.]|uniref:adenylyl-sulfate kinase n=1 Tax=Piscinibacter sp. TaxID=1903157 RepID=UPI002ED10360